MDKKIESIRAYIDYSKLGGGCGVLEIVYKNGKQKILTGINPVDQDYITFDTVISFLMAEKNREEK